MGDIPRRIPLHRGAPGVDRRHRARRRLRAALGLRLGRRAVRNLAGRRLEAGRRVGAGRHRCRRGALQGAATEVGLRWAGRQGWRRSYAGGLVVGLEEKIRRAFDPARVRAPDLPCAAARRTRADRRQRRQDGVRGRGRSPVDTGIRPGCRGTGAVDQDQGPRHRSGCDQRPAEGGGARGVAVPRPCHLVARRTIFGRCRPAGDDAGVHVRRRQGDRCRSAEDCRMPTCA